MTNTKLAVILGVVAVSLVFAGGFVVSWFGFSSTCNQHENGIQAQYAENQNTYDNGYKKVVEAAQITDKQAGDLQALYSDVLKGVKDSNSLMLALGQFNPAMDQGTYRKVQQLVEAFRNDFRERQTELIARKNQYKNYLTVDWGGRFFNQFAGYPHIDMTKYDIVTSGRTVAAFETKQDEPLKLNDGVEGNRFLR